MTNKEKYQRAFSVLHASDRLMEVKAMEKTKRSKMPKVFAVCAAVVFIMGMATVAYAADIGGIKTTIQFWVHGAPVNAELSISQDEITHYTITYEDSDGETHEQHGGGIAFEPDGTQRELTEEEVMANLEGPDVFFEDDGSVWVYYKNQQIDITNEFNEDGMFYLQLDGDNETWYVTAQSDGSAFVSNDGFYMP